MEIIFLGTGAGVPSKERNVSSLALVLLQEINEIWLFDCGEATQHQILHTSIKPGKIKKIFITHLHGDHIFGLPGLLGSRSFQGGNDLLTIYGPPGVKTFIESCIRVSKTHLTYPLKIVEISAGKILETEKFIVHAKELEHGIQSFGFRIVEKDRPGALQTEKLSAIGIPPGPIYKQIKENTIVTTADGQTLLQKDFLGPSKPGRVISILGDTRRTEKNSAFVEDSDVLVHEATFGHESKDLAVKYYHSTAVEAALLAKYSAVKQLVLTHLSSRYQKENIHHLLEEARNIFPNALLAEDLFRLPIMPKD